MFTGLIEAVGTLTKVADGAAEAAPMPLRRLQIETPWRGTQVPVLGASVAVDGVCLTVTERDETTGLLAMQAASETRRRTTLGAAKEGGRVHLERALRFGDRLDGHLVSGHVDGVGTVLQAEADGSAWRLRVHAPRAVLALSAPQGSVTLAGVSLTITAMGDDWLEVGLVPHTLQETALGALVAGDLINCEADLLARYVAGLLRRSKGVPP